MSEKYGFVYLWYDRKHKRFYIGCRWGREDDGYICSSTWMKQGYKHRPNDFKRRILTKIYTNKKDLLEEEYKWLSLIKKEELGKKYYNLHNHHFGHWATSPETHMKSVEKMRQTKIRNNALLSEKERKEKFGTQRGKPSVFKGKTHSEKAKAKIKEKRKNQVFSEETLEKKRKQVPWNKGKTGIYSEETKKKMAWSSGKKLGPRSDEVKSKIGRKNSEHMKRIWQTRKAN